MTNTKEPEFEHTGMTFEEWIQTLPHLAEPVESKRVLKVKNGLEIDCSPVPPQMIPPFLTPNGITIIYGPGGVGKGLFTVYLMMQLIRQGKKTLIVDFESHEQEWGDRKKRLGLTDEESKNLFYLAPFSEDWNGERGTFAQMHLDIKQVCEDNNIDVILVDSYIPATDGDESMGGQKGAKDFFEALRIIGKPGCVIAHVTKDGGRFPQYPYGSVYVNNFARETWAMEAAETEIVDIKDSFAEEDTEVVALELRQKKSNSSKKVPSYLITFICTPDKITFSEITSDKLSIRAMISSVLVVPMTINEIIEAIKTDYDKDYISQNIKTTLERNPSLFEKANESRPYKWQKINRDTTLWKVG